jgi:hypothetical protein
MLNPISDLENAWEMTILKVVTTKDLCKELTRVTDLW